MMNKKRLVIFVILLCLLTAGLLWWHSRHAPDATGAPADATSTKTAKAKAGGGRRGGPGPRGMQAPVQVSTARRESVPWYLNGLGTVTPINTVTVTSRVEGQLMALHFQEGQQVKQGALLAEIDPRPYQVALTQAQGQLEKDKATLTNARRDLARYEKLARTHLVSQQELDNQRALVSQAEGSIKSDQGAVDNARLQLTYSRVTAPISGRVGLKQVDVGNHISGNGATPLVVITQTQPIDVLFTVPESAISAILQARKQNAALPVEVWDRNNENKLADGKLISLDNQIDASTGTIKLKARFSNQDDQLFPNQFVNVRLRVTTLQDVVVIPPAALQMNNSGHFVWVVDSTNKVSKHAVTVGMQDSQRVVIKSGVQAGDRVITDGVDRLTDGTVVTVVDPLKTSATGASATPATGAAR